MLMRKQLMVNQPYKIIDPKSTMSEERVASALKYLRNAFVSACYEYRDSHSKASTGFLRDKSLALIVSSNDDMTLYYVQVEYNYLVDAISRGPIFAVPTLIKKGNELVDSLLRKVNR
jgi:hypothetical protein